MKALRIYEKNARILHVMCLRKNRVDECLFQVKCMSDWTNNDNDESNATGSNSAAFYKQEINSLLEYAKEEMNSGPCAKSCDEIDAYLKVASTKMLLKDWSGAKLTCQNLMNDYPEQHMMTPSQHQELFMKVSRCFYELGEYDRSICVGTGAIEMNRHYPGVHKYVALSHKELGNIEDAETLLTR